MAICQMNQCEKEKAHLHGSVYSTDGNQWKIWMPFNDIDDIAITFINALQLSGIFFPDEEIPIV